MKKLIIWILTILIIPVLQLYSQDNILAHITVESGDYTRNNTPISVSLDGFVLNSKGFLRLEEIKGVEIIPVPSQIEYGTNPRLWWVLSGETESGTKRLYRIYYGDEVKYPEIFTLINEKNIQIIHGKNPVLQYNHAAVPPPEGIDSIYTRSGFIHPLWSPSGEELTRIQPPDHYHHLGIWNPWTKTNFEGREIDFWNLGKGQGTVRFKGIISLLSGKVFGGFRLLHEHVDITDPGNEKTALNEEWNVMVWNTGGRENGYWLLDFYSTLNCASSSPVILEKYSYAGFGFRATELWTNKNSKILTSEGLTRKDGDGTSAKWCIVTGKMQKDFSGIVFMSHPNNRGHPEPMRIWEENSNGGRGDVFFQFNPVRNYDWKLEPGNNYVLRYRMYVYEGEISQTDAELLWQNFAFPPTVKIDIKND